MIGWRRFAGVFVLLSLALAACTGPGSAVPRGVNEGNRARDFTLESLAGEQVSLHDYLGDVVLINFWATWCAPCRAEIPDLEAAYRAHKDSGFVVLGVGVEDTRQGIESFVAEMNMTYPVLLDESGTLMKEYRGLGLPMSVMVDRDGIIQVRHVGYLSATQLESYLSRLMAIGGAD